MKARILLAPAAGVAVLAILLLERREPGPKFVLDEPSRMKRVGPSSPDRTHRVSFRVRNDGTADLHLRRFLSGCGCAKVEAGQRVLAPGQTTTVDVDVIPPEGAKNYIPVRIVTNEARRNEHTLEIMAFGKGRVRVEVVPATIDIDRVRSGGATVEVLAFAEPTDGTPQLLKVETPAGIRAVTPEVPEQVTIRNLLRYRWAVEILQAGAIDPATRVVYLTIAWSDGEAKGRVDRMPVVVAKHPAKRLRVEPPVLSLTPGTETEARVRSADQTPCRVVDYRLTPADLADVSCFQSGDTASTRVRIRCNRVVRRGVLTLVIKHRGHPRTVRIPIVGEDG